MNRPSPLRLLLPLLPLLLAAPTHADMVGTGDPATDAMLEQLYGETVINPAKLGSMGSGTRNPGDIHVAERNLTALTGHPVIIGLEYLNGELWLTSRGTSLVPADSPAELLRIGADETSLTSWDIPTQQSNIGWGDLTYNGSQLLAGQRGYDIDGITTTDPTGYAHQQIACPAINDSNPAQKWCKQLAQDRNIPGEYWAVWANLSSLYKIASDGTATEQVTAPDLNDMGLTFGGLLHDGRWLWGLIQEKNANGDNILQIERLNPNGTDKTNLRSDPPLSFSGSSIGLAAGGWVGRKDDKLVILALINHNESTGLYEFDVTPVVVSPIDSETSEGGDTAQFSLVLNTPPTQDVTISLTGDPTYGNLSATSVTFTPANWDTPQQVDVTGLNHNHTQDAGPAIYTITSQVSSGDSYFDGLIPDPVTITHLDTDSAGLLLTPASLGIVEGQSDNFVVTLTSEPLADVTLSPSSSDPTNATLAVIDPLSGTCILNASNWNSGCTLSVTSVDDASADGSVPLLGTLTASSSDANYQGLSSDIAITAIDNDTAGIALTPANVSATEGGANGRFSLVLTTLPSADVTLTLTNNNPAEASLSASTLTFTPANWNIPQATDLIAIDDAVADGPQSFTIDISSASTDGDYQGLNDTLNATTLDNDQLGMTVSPTSLSTNEGGSANFTLSLTSEPNGFPVTITPSAKNADGSAATEVSFTPNPWVINSTTADQLYQQTFGLTLADDDIKKIDKQLSIHFTAAGADYDTQTTSAQLTLLDNDTTGVRYTDGTNNPITQLSLTQGETTTFKFYLTSQPSGSLTYSVGGETDTVVTMTPSQVTLDATNWNSGVPIELTAVGSGTLNVDFRIIATNATEYPLGNLQRLPVDVTPPPPEITVNQSNLTAQLTLTKDGEYQFTFLLTAKPNGSVTYSVQGSDDAIGTPSPASITLNETNWELGETITITALQNGSMTVTFTVTGATGLEYTIDSSTHITVRASPVPVAAPPTPVPTMAFWSKMLLVLLIGLLSGLFYARRSERS